MENCLFCRIINGEIPSTKVYEDDMCLAFKDIDPQAPTHILVIPKKHIGSAAEVDAENSVYVSHIFEKIVQISRDMGMTDGFRVVSNCGESAGQTVHHLHFPVMAGRTFTWPAG